MATSVLDLYQSLLREINPPGFEQFPDITPGDGMGYIEDGFWEGRLTGLFSGYSVIAGEDLDTPTDDGLYYISGSEDADFPKDLQMLVVILAGYRLIQRKAFTLAQNYAAKAGPVEYEVQMSATVLRELLQSMERRIQTMRELHSSTVPANAFYYMDGVAQTVYSTLNGLAELAIIY